MAAKRGFLWGQTEITFEIFKSYFEIIGVFVTESPLFTIKKFLSFQWEVFDKLDNTLLEHVSFSHVLVYC